jgi:hypothetical protein
MQIVRSRCLEDLDIFSLVLCLGRAWLPRHHCEWRQYTYPDQSMALPGAFTGPDYTSNLVGRRNSHQPAKCLGKEITRSREWG